MPLYEYECSKGHRFELIRKFSDPPVKKCPKCSAKVTQLLSSPAIHFKGSGWYVTDYAKKGVQSESSKSEEKAAEKTESKSETKADTKTETKAESKDKKKKGKPSVS